MSKSMLFILLSFILLSLYSPSIEAQELGSCGQREFAVEYPRVEPVLFCIEQPPLDISGAGEWAFTALAFTEDGNFYATRPHRGELFQLSDSDGDALPDTVNLVLSGLRLPNGLAVDNNRLFILGDGIIYAYENEELSIITEELPRGQGFIPSGITVHDSRLYIGIPFPCDFCESENDLHGTVLSMDFSGENREILARGLRYPAGLFVHQNILYVSDSAYDAQTNLNADEINRFDLSSSEIPHFGFPYCSGAENTPELTGNFDCHTASVPHWVFPTGSVPTAIESYDANTYPWLSNQLLLVLSGDFDNSTIEGYSILALREDAERSYVETLVPVDREITRGRTIFQSTDGLIQTTSANLINRRGAGTWPHRIYDIAISPEGWIYFSVGGEGIYVLRPGNQTISEVCERWRDCD